MEIKKHKKEDKEKGEKNKTSYDGTEGVDSVWYNCNENQFSGRQWKVKRAPPPISADDPLLSAMLSYPSF